MTEQGITIIQLPAWDLYRTKTDDELGLRVYVSRRIIHSFFKKKEILDRFPLVVKVPDPKAGKEKLLNLSLREEYYGRIACRK